jgi:hypothetical protein
VASRNTTTPNRQNAKLVLALVSITILGSKSHGIHDYILLFDDSATEWNMPWFGLQRKHHLHGYSAVAVFIYYHGNVIITLLPLLFHNSGFISH